MKQSNRVRRVTAGVLLGLAAALVLALAGFWLIDTLGAARQDALGIYRDVFGRELRPAPSIARYFLGQEKLWPGFWWYAAQAGGTLALGGVSFGLVMGAHAIDPHVS